MTFFRIPRFLPAVFQRQVWRISSVPGAIYLTFDDGPIPEVTPWILDLLKAQEIKATFFCVGENVRRYPEIYQRIVSEGHTVGNHTMRHEKGIRTKRKAYIQSIEEAATEINSKLFRPPYGLLTWQQSRMIRKNYKIIMWSWLSSDYDRTVPIDRILEKAKIEIQSGDIAVFHDNIKSSDRIKQILPEFLNILRDKHLLALPITI
jgi:peptidoglycan/xylan/chitin deacetylase (PgdA/CDA1 family)